MKGIRDKHRWKVQLTDGATGHKVEEVVESYWDPEKDGTKDAIGTAARLQANKRNNAVFVPIGDPVLVS